jgi:hypothetical protein
MIENVTTAYLETEIQEYGKLMTTALSAESESRGIGGFPKPLR